MPPPRSSFRPFVPYGNVRSHKKGTLHVHTIIPLTPFQRAVLRRLVQGISAYASPELRLLGYLMIFLVLETLDVTPAQIDSVLGVGVTTLLNELVDEGAESALLHVPVFGAVAPDGRIAYTEQAQRWLQEHDHVS